MAEGTVEQRMKTGVLSVGPSEKLSDVATLLEARKISAVPILENGDLVGVISTTDLVDELVLSASTTKKAGDLARRGVITIKKDARVSEAAALFKRERVHRLFVVDEGKLAGVLSTSDLLTEVRDRGDAAPISTLMARSVLCIDLGTTLGDTVRQLSSAYVHGLVVLDGSLPVGVFTHREALATRKIFHMIADRNIEDLMSYETICLDENTPIHRAARYAQAMDVRRLLVVRNRALVGVVSAFDFACTLDTSASA